MSKVSKQVNNPFTEQESEIMDLLVKAHTKFIELPKNDSHPMEVSEWVFSFHKLQDLLGARILRRNWPKTFR